MDKDQLKRKNDLFKSIMTNPKLSKQFRDAMAAPVGSTKREQAKSVFSIMKKVGGMKSDGQGGPFDFGGFLGTNTGLSTTSLPQSSSSTSTNLGNSIIFPAATLKTFTPTTPTTPTTTPATSGISLANSISNFNTSTAPKTATTTPLLGSNPSAPISFNSTSNYQPVVPATPAPSSGLWSSLLGGLGQGIIDTTGAISGLVKGMFTKPTAPLATVGPKTGGQTTATGYIPEFKNLTSAITTPTTPAQKPVVTPTTDTTKSKISALAGITTGGTDLGTTVKTGTGTNLAATNVAKYLGLTPTTTLTQVDIPSLADAIATNEGYFNGTSTVAIKNNNPGNLKFANQPGATLGENGFAVFSTIQEGAKALINDLTAKVQSGKYSTINDLMSVYSPDSDNPALTGGTSTDTTGSTDTSQITQEQYDAMDTAQRASLALGQVGKEQFALSEAQRLAGGTVTQLNAADDTALRQKYGIDALEAELSRKKAEGENFVPSMQNYIRGRDEYLKEIDTLIEKTIASDANADLSDPHIAAQHKTYLNYLYTLKGRQEARYGNFLDSAIKDYNADIAKTQAAYESTYNKYLNAINKEGAINKEEYDSILASAAGTYQMLQDAPLKAEQYKAAVIQNLSNNQTMLDNIEKASGITDPDYLKNLTALAKFYTVDKGISDAMTGGLDLTKVGPDGLFGIYSRNAYQGGKPEVVTDMLTSALTKSLQAAAGDPAKVAEVKKLIDDLRASATGYDEASATEINKWADKLSTAVQPAAKEVLGGFILTNLSTIKSAVNDLVKGGWFGKPGIEDKVGWMKKYESTLGKQFLESLYNTISVNVGSGTAYSEDPMSYVKQLFSGATDQQNADNLAARMAVSS